MLPEQREFYTTKAIDAFKLGKQFPGVCQTAPCRASYFYEEDNWVDDMELAAAELWRITGQVQYLEDAVSYAMQEPVTPWMGADTARHYQWYPFINIGHFEAATSANPKTKKLLQEYYKNGLDRIWHRAKDNAFLMGVPFIWCSNNLVAALATQCLMYRHMSGDNSFISIETAMRDWLLGCNPWGVSMIIGLPEDGTYAHDPHSSLAHLHQYKLSGGLLDGPVYRSIYDRQKYVHLTEDDEYQAFQSNLAVYHDDVGDYATNEPTMDGSATLVYYLAAMQNEANRTTKNNRSGFREHKGAIIRADSSSKKIALVFTGNKYADGAQSIISVLNKNQIKASFFLTGNFYRNEKFATVIQELKNSGHYLGAHSDRHLLYCDWQERDKLLVTKTEFVHDLNKNYLEMQKFGIERNDALYYLPSFEWYNQTISNWTADCGLQLINYSPGTLTHADYTDPSMGNKYISSEKILNSITEYEEKSATGLNGFILLMHIGVSDKRVDKFYTHLSTVIRLLRLREYTFFRIDDLIEDAQPVADKEI
jgi:peptidoglycan/xylan/chitin deacetylase (PgdA/CDA1 family)